MCAFGIRGGVYGVVWGLGRGGRGGQTIATKWHAAGPSVARFSFDFIARQAQVARID